MRLLRPLSRRLSTEQAGKHVPFGETGAGFYTEKTKGCFDVINRCAQPALAAVDRALAARKQRGAVGTPFQIADFGTADGGTSIPLLTKLIRAVRQAEPKSPIVVLYEDQDQNDWASLFKLTQGKLEHGPETYLDGSIDDVYVLASGTSFYQKCFAPGSIDFAFCATAMHWLTNVPTQIPDALHSACTADAAAKAAFGAQAARDWEHILLNRAHELAPGGQAVIANFAVDDANQFLGTSGRVAASMHGTFSELWLEVAGAEIHRATNFCNEYRSLEACAAPFDASGSAVTASGLRLLSAETALVPCPYHLEWVSGEGPYANDPAGHAAHFVPTTRTWSNSTFESGATSMGVAPEAAAEMADEMFHKYVERVAKAPQDHAMDYVHSYLHIERAA